MRSNRMFIRAAVNIPSDKTFFYTVPEALQNDVAVGKRALVPFGNRKRTAYIIEVTAAAHVDKVKEVIRVLDRDPLFNEQDLAFYQWISQYYMYPLGKALADILPGGIDQRGERYLLRLNGADSQSRALTIQHRAILDVLDRFPQGISEGALKKALGAKNIGQDVAALQKLEMIRLEDRIKRPRVGPKREKIVTASPGNEVPVGLTPKQALLLEYVHQDGPVALAVLSKRFGNASLSVKALEKKGLIQMREQEVFRHPQRSPDLEGCGDRVTLNEDQQRAVEAIHRNLSSHRYATYVLHGVTGSGKTEVYLRMIQQALFLQGGVICLVPEIALTPQLLSRFKERLTEQEIAVLHSGIPEAVRFDEWRRIQAGEIRIVVGARSALFAPVRDLKLIIIDEEHDPSYKQQDRLRYHARDMAVVKGKMHNATVVLGSATPSVQTFFNAKRNKYGYLHLPRRVEGRMMPEILIVDMRMEKDPGGKPPVLSRCLKAALQETLHSGKQAVLFLNRRGFDTLALCVDCGYAFKCLNCALSLTHHAGEGRLKCHACDYTMAVPARCPSCGGGQISWYGTGTEKVQSEIGRLFPDARIGRMDSDTMAKRGSIKRILQALQRRDLDILVGTQMITKGHDFPDITLVGVISADTAMNVPEYTATERTFQILTQVSGRSGRGDIPGRVVIQTFNPDHYAIQRAKNHDYEGFYEGELLLRQSLSYPPFARMVSLHLSSMKRDEGWQEASDLGKYVRELCAHHDWREKIQVVGLAESPIARIKGRYRWQLLLKGTESQALHELTMEILTHTRRSSLDIKVDVDPVHFM